MSNQSAHQPYPGEAFRVPLVGANPRFVQESGPCAPGTSVGLKQGSAVKAALNKFENLDIVRSYFLECDWSTTFTEGASEVITQSPLWPYNLVESLSLSMQAAYRTMDLPGWLAQVFQQFRSSLAPRSFTANFQNGANQLPGSPGGSDFYTNAVSLGTPDASLSVGGSAQSYRTFIEIPIAQYFDLYWEIDPETGEAVVAMPRAIVSPARMSATQRNVTPSLRFSQLLSATSQYDAPATIASSDDTSTASGSVDLTWWRDGWVPTDNPLSEPPGYAWQYARMGLDVQPAGARAPVVNLADDRAGQGQILSMVFGVWDPAASGGIGNFTSPADYESLELNIGSTVQLFQDSPQSNAYRWTVQHGTALPFGLFGWDLALTDDGKLTNENAINTLVQAGAQIIPTFVSGKTPSNNATLYVGVESLQSVTS